jgi:hypothetical protein
MTRLALTLAALVALATHDARAQAQSDSLPQAMLGTWCPQKDDKQGTPMKRCAPGSPNVIRMMPHAMDTKSGGRCRVVSVKTLSATRWTVAFDCEAEPDRTYGWQFFRAGVTLYLTPTGGFVPRGD